MTISLVSGQTAGNQSAGIAALSVTLPGSVTAGNSILCGAKHRGTFTSWTDNLSNTYVNDLTYTDPSGDSNIDVGAARKLATGGTCTVTMTQGSSTRCFVGVMEVNASGGNGVEPEATVLNNVNFPASTTTSYSSGAASSAGACVAYACVGNGFNGSPIGSLSGSAVSFANGGTTGRAETIYEFIASGGSHTITGTFAASVNYASGMVLYKETAGGGGSSSSNFLTLLGVG